MDGATAFTVHLFNLDGAQERYRRAIARAEGKMTVEQQLKFVRTLRAQWAREGNKGRGVQMLGAIAASLERVAKFTRKKP